MNSSNKTIVAALFDNHYTYYRDIGNETIQQQAGQVEQVSADYQGRVIFELLQNAFDKAEKAILVTVKNGCLYVANDGTPFTYQSWYKYKEGASHRADFQSLCSISTSTKDANTSIGNKGVGFKSVFSVAAQGYVNLYTQGKVLLSEGQCVTIPIYFSVFDSFKNHEALPGLLPEDIRIELAQQINLLQTERKDRGVPGYYYPVQLPDADEYAADLFKQGFVTVVQIPFAEGTTKEIETLFEEIKKVHFDFVRLRVPKEIKITFEFAGKSELCFAKHIKSPDDDVAFIHCRLNEKVKKLAQEAKISISSPQVALRFKSVAEDSEGLLYNYLPTKVKSPFRYVDFHADFHTTVDRKTINFEGKIGDYNRALLTGCLELYFIYLNSYIEQDQRVTLGAFEWINPSSIPKQRLKRFKWQYLDTVHNAESYHAVRRILAISNRSYQIGSKFIAGLAKKYFENTQSSKISEHKQFVSKSLSFIDTYARTHNESWDWPILFRQELANQLKQLDARIIPAQSGIMCSINDELVYRDQNSEGVQSFIPPFVGISFTSFKIEDGDFRRALGIKEFTDRNEVLKYFRQVSPSGKFHGPEKQLTEAQQQELLRSISTLMGKTGDNIPSTHRYNGFISRNNNSDNTAANLADFSISTVFLKTKIGKYKPAQLCTVNEVDDTFLPVLPDHIKSHTFLKYLGVSFCNNHYFTEKLIWEALKDGLDYIPILWQSAKTQEDQLRRSKVLESISVVTHGRPVHPALINDNDYPFLEKLRIQDFYEEAQTLLIKKYDEFPREYLSKLIAVCIHGPIQKESLLKFYQHIFQPLHRHLEQYLVLSRGNLSFVRNSNFYIVSSQYEFHLVESLNNLDKPVLCYYKSKLEPYRYSFQGNFWSSKKGTSKWILE